MTKGELKEGQKAPGFKLDDQDGKSRDLADFKGKAVVLYFYPRADTPGCTIQACGARDRSKDYDKAGAVVLGISPDQPEDLRKFADKFDLNFTLLADPDHSTAEDYGVWVEKSMYGKKYMGVERSTFIIGPDRKLQTILRKVNPKTHDDVVLEALG